MKKPVIEIKKIDSITFVSHWAARLLYHKRPQYSSIEGVSIEKLYYVPENDDYYTTAESAQYMAEVYNADTVYEVPVCVIAGPELSSANRIEQYEEVMKNAREYIRSTMERTPEDKTERTPEDITEFTFASGRAGAWDPHDHPAGEDIVSKQVYMIPDCHGVLSYEDAMKVSQHTPVFRINIVYVAENNSDDIDQWQLEDILEDASRYIWKTRFTA